MGTEITQYITRGLIAVITIALSILSVYLLNYFKGSRFEKPIRFFALGFIFVAFAKIIAIATKFLIESKVIPKSLKWIMSMYEVFGMIGLLIIIAGVYCLLYGACSGLLLTDSNK
jgi:hypothetical protein